MAELISSNARVRIQAFPSLHTALLPEEKMKSKSNTDGNNIQIRHGCSKPQVSPLCKDLEKASMRMDVVGKSAAPRSGFTVLLMGLEALAPSSTLLNSEAAVTSCNLCKDTAQSSLFN